MTSAWWTRHRRPVALVAAAVALGLAALWVVVVPDRAAETTGAQYVAVRWGHSASWLLLAVAALCVAFEAPARLRDGALVGAGLCYAAFVAATVL